MRPTSRIRLLMTTDTVGGVWTYSCALATNLARSGVDVTLVTIGPRARPEQRAILKGSPVRLMETDLALEWQDPEGRDIDEARRVLAALEARVRPDIIHLNSFREATFLWHAPTIVVAHSCVNSWALACRDTVWLNEPRWTRYTEQVATALDKTQVWVTPSQSFHDDITDIYRPHTPGVVIWNGIVSRALGGRKRDQILAAGRLWDRGKNIETLTSAAPGLQWPVHVAGAGGANMPNSVEWLGQISHDDLRARLQRAAIFVSSALYEPFGLSVLEAAAAGCALVLSNIPTFRELWSGAAVFFDPQDSQALHQILDGLCTDTAARVRLQGAAYEHSLSYALPRTTEAYLSLYKDLLQSRQTNAPAMPIEVRA